MTDNANPETVSLIFNLDTGTLRDEVPRRYDGTPATPDEIEAVRNARSADLQAVLELHRLALEQAKYEMDRKVRIVALIDKYRRNDELGDTTIGAIVPRFSPVDLAEWRRLWDDLGGVMVLSR